MMKSLLLLFLWCLPAFSQAVSLVSMSPSSGYIRPEVQTAFTFRAILPGTGTEWIHIKFGTDPSVAASTCYLVVVNPNMYGLVLDDVTGTNFGYTNGFQGFSNSQCDVMADPGLTMDFDGSYYWTIRITFHESFRGRKTIYWDHVASRFAIVTNNVFGHLVVGQPPPKLIMIVEQARILSSPRRRTSHENHDSSAVPVLWLDSRRRQASFQSGYPDRG